MLLISPFALKTFSFFLDLFCCVSHGADSRPQDFRADHHLSRYISRPKRLGKFLSSLRGTGGNNCKFGLVFGFIKSQVFCLSFPSLGNKQTCRLTAAKPGPIVQVHSVEGSAKLRGIRKSLFDTIKGLHKATHESKRAGRVSLWEITNAINPKTTALSRRPTRL